MIMMRLRITVRTAKPRKVVNRDMLRDPETRSKFNALVKDYVRAKAGQPPDGSAQLETLHEAMSAAAKATITIRPAKLSGLCATLSVIATSRSERGALHVKRWSSQRYVTARCRMLGNERVTRACVCSVHNARSRSSST